MIRPANLVPGNTIAITCPSGYMDREKVNVAVAKFESWGLNVIVGDTVGVETHNYFSGSDQQRMSELQQYLDDPNIHAIMMGRGGYGMSRIIDDIQWDNFIHQPKWICGFSDITLLHNHLQSMGYQSLHSPMCAAFIDNGAAYHAYMIQAVHQILFGEVVSYPDVYHARHIPGSAQGRLVGGNLAMVTHAVGTSSAIKVDNNILFLEDVGEHLYKIDRMLLQLKRADILQQLCGVIYGQFTDAEDTTRPFGKELDDILLSHVSGYGIPVCLGFPAGHDVINYPLILGAKYQLNIHDKIASIKLL